MKSRFGMMFVFLLTLLAFLGASARAEGVSEDQRAAGRELVKRIATAVERYPLGDVTGWFETLGVWGRYVIGTNRNLIHIYVGGPDFYFQYPLSGGSESLFVDSVSMVVAKNNQQNLVQITLNNNRKTCMTADDLVSSFSPIRPPQYFKGTMVFSSSEVKAVADRSVLPDVMRFVVSAVNWSVQVEGSIRYFEGFPCLGSVYLTYVD